MSVLKTKDNKEMIISCKCGCKDGVHFKIDKEDCDMYCITTFTNSNWYRDQNDTILRVIGRKMKKIISILRNKDYVLKYVNVMFYKVFYLTIECK